MKPNLSLAAILSTAAIAYGTLLGALTPIQAETPSQSVTAGGQSSLGDRQPSPATVGLVVGIVTIAGLLAVGIFYDLTRSSRQQNPVAEID